MWTRGSCTGTPLRHSVRMKPGRLCGVRGRASQIETYRLAAEAHREESQGASRFSEVKDLSWPEFKYRRPELRGIWFRMWGEHADSENLALAAHDLLAAETPEDQLQYLSVFQCRAFTLEHTCLLRLAEHHDGDIADAACAALANITESCRSRTGFQGVGIRWVGARALDFPALAERGAGRSRNRAPLV